MLSKKILTAAAVAALTLSACGSDDSAQDVAVCANRVTGEVLPDGMCNSYSGGGFPEWMAYMYVSQAVFNSHYGSFQPGHVISHTEINNYGTTYAAPRNGTRVATRDGVVRKADVYTAKQAGKPVKFNQDAKKVSSVVGTPAYKTQQQKAVSKQQSWGQTSTSNKSKPSWGTSSSYKPAKTGKCC